MMPTMLSPQDRDAPYRDDPDHADALPDPVRDGAFYRDTTTKRFGAWVIDVCILAVIFAVLTVLSLFTALLVLPFVWMGLSFLYRWASIAQGSATPGMRVMAIEFRDAGNRPFDSGAALMHTLGYTVSMAVFPLQLVSIVLMLTTEKRQGLTDHLLGSAALNLRA